MIHTSAPATLMLMGEHAVLHGEPALVAAASSRLHVYLNPRSDRQISIQSALGQLQTDLDHLSIAAPFQFILTVIQNAQCQQGFDLTVQSEFGATFGLGSSAAVLVATALALRPKASTKEIFDLCYQSLIQVQGRGSGADLIAAILGGIVFYRQIPFQAEKIWPQACFLPLPMTLLYCGYKTPTPEVIARVEAARQSQPAHFETLFHAIGEQVQRGKQSLLQGDLAAFGQCLQANQSLMEELGVADSTLLEMIRRLEATPGIMAAKISGSGLGDCVFGLGEAEWTSCPWQKLALQLSPQGMSLHHD